MTMTDVETHLAPRLLSVLRIVASLIMLEHGFQKILNFPPSPNPGIFTTLGTAAGIIEICGGLPLILGLFSRPIAFIFSGEMAIAYFIRHAERGLYPVNNGGELAILLCFVFLFLAAAGPGIWSLDSMRVRRNPKVQALNSAD